MMLLEVIVVNNKLALGKRNFAENLKYEDGEEFLRLI
ncbi:hypothetical protein BDE27_1735 [Xenorhabdus ehlersii]|uniref:Uncharacterized protein n=1 Tax=Xenorhabdus ehlersii TaxID=290111 RepID=A0A2D0ILL6_9GAMM|nr:hypothetical protein [Xenorhabdus sp. TS4]PHM22686.1 hypothetical protein Xehl_03452 [Xenorhabdus ehlersii]RKE91496.1 hypothetical protein BDE27_1735 [Xenorhabdus ehlersii]